MQKKNLHFKTEFDPLFETIGLLYFVIQKNDKDEVIKELYELGVDGEKFYQKYMKIIERYAEAFEKAMTMEPDMEFFFRQEEEPETLFYLIVALLVEHREWMDSLDGVSEEELRSIIAYVIKDDGEKIIPLCKAKMPVLADEGEMIEYLADVDCTDGMKWHLLELLRRPVYWVARLTRLVKSNIPAYEKALSGIRKPLEPLMKRYEKFEDEQFVKMTETCAPGSDVYPSLIAGVAQQVYYTQAYEGIFVEYLLKKGKSRDERKESLVLRAKAMGDKSKLDILCALKESSKYNLELAETLGLSASTMSHHMNVLFACGFVNIEKKDGRVYYCLQREALEEFVADLKRLLL